jgi:hypothetical protein
LKTENYDCEAFFILKQAAKVRFFYLFFTFLYEYSKSLKSSLMKQVFFLFLFCATTCFAQNTTQSYADFLQEAAAFAEAKNFIAAHDNYRKAFLLAKKQPNDLFAGACVAALAEQKTDAFTWLEAAAEAGWNDMYDWHNNSSLAALRNTAEWTKAAAVLETKLGAKYEQALVDELAKINLSDQSIRKKYAEAKKILGNKHLVLDSLRQVMALTDSINTLKIGKILDEKGWLGRTRIGDGNNTLFAIIQHSDLKTQQKYLPMMRDAVKKGNAQGSSLCLLEDRMATSEGKKQRYGTQIGTRKKTKQAYILPIEDPDNLDKRRAEMGLRPIAEYVKHWEIVWDLAAYKAQAADVAQWAKEDYPKDYK